MPAFSTALRTRSISPYQPVVPTTIAFCARMHASILARTASGVVKSITTSMSRRWSSVSHPASLLVAESMILTSMSALARDFGNQRAGLARPQHHKV